MPKRGHTEAGDVDDHPVVAREGVGVGWRSKHPGKPRFGLVREKPFAHGVVGEEHHLEAGDGRHIFRNQERTKHGGYTTRTTLVLLPTMIEVKATCSEGALEHAVNVDIAEFEKWFRGLGNDALVRSEMAILKTYLFWKVKGESDAKRLR